MRKAFLSVVIALILTVTASAVSGVGRISAETAVLIDASDGEVLFARGAEQKMQPASMTKIMTAILVIENCAPDAKVTVKQSCVNIEGSSAYLQTGEVFTVEELLYALLLQSANDAACALADFCGGYDAFVVKMNDKAAELGLNNTHYVNPHGLSSENHFSTAHDTAVLLCYCMKNPVFRRISGTVDHVIEPDESRRGRYFTNHNKLIYTVDGVCGGKTGYTISSGRCLCSYYEKDGVSLCAVTMNAPRDWDDHAQLYEYGKSLYETITLDAAGVYKLHIVGGVSDTAVCTVEDDARVTVKKNGEKIRKVVYMRRFEYAPVYAGEQTGSVVFFKGDRVIYEAPLYADNKVEAKKDAFKDMIKWKR